MNLTIKWIITSFSLICQATLISQAESVKFFSVDNDQGIQKITCIKQDSYGFLWIGTRNGLYRFDGYRFESYDNRMSRPGFYHTHYITEIIELSGILYIGTLNNGLYAFHYRENHFEKIKLPRQHNIESVTGMVADKNSNILWLATSYGFWGYQLNKKEFVTASNNPLTGTYISCIAIDKNNRLFLGTLNQGLWTYNIGLNQIKPVSAINERTSNKGIRSIYPDMQNKLWIGTIESGLYRLSIENENFSQIDYFPAQKYQFSNYLILSMLQDSKGYLWMGTENGGLYRLNPLNFDYQIYRFKKNDPYSIPSNSIWALFEDYQNILWIGTFNKGLVKIDPNANKFDLYPNEQMYNELNGSTVTSFYLRKNTLLFGTDGDGLRSIDLHTLQKGKPTIKTVLPIPRNVLNISPVSNQLWIGTWDMGLTITRQQNFSHVIQTIYPLDHVFAVTEDREGNIWVGTWGNGIYLHHRKLQKVLRFTMDTATDYTIGSNNIFTIVQDSYNRVWIGTLDGLSKVEKKADGSYQVTNYRHRENDSTAISSNLVLCIYEDANRNIWLGTNSGINKYLSTKNYFVQYNQLNTFEVNAIIEDKHQRLWLGTNKGLVRFIPESGQWKLFNKKDGMLLNGFSNNAVVNLADTLLIFGGVGGLLAFHPLLVKENTFPPKIVATRIKIHSQKMLWADTSKTMFQNLTGWNRIDLKPYQNTFTIEFTALNFTYPEQNQYAVKIKEIDQDWHYIGNQNFITYTGLKPGTYHFMLKGSNNDGVWSTTDYQLLLVIHPYFWQTWWFRLLVIMIIAGYLAYLIYRRIRNVEEKLELKTNILKMERWKQEQNQLLSTKAQLDQALEEKNKELSQISMQVVKMNEKLLTIHDQITDLLQKSPNRDFQRMLLQLQESIEEDLNQKENWKLFETGINLNYDNFIQRFWEKYPSLTHKDIKFCAYIRMNLSNKEIANLLNITLRSVESIRYRIRRKIGLPGDQNLNEFIMKF